ncbi:SDR family oxidoreductase, partial [Streptomyces sp. Vc714c-19]|uniref:SDR family oxidoreductase n=1 Tax=Streptomyces sp. Vc714c-19 TaxID=2841673 RepID=UPI002095CCC0
AGPARVLQVDGGNLTESVVDPAQLPLRPADPAELAGGGPERNAVLAREPSPRLITTSAARAGLLNLSKSLSRELAPDGIRVNSVCLGLVDTGQWERRHRAEGGPLDYDRWQAAL